MPKKLLIPFSFLFISFSTLAWTGWQSINFILPSDFLSEPLRELAARNDQALYDIQAVVPSVEEQVRSTLTRSLQIAANSVSAPQKLENVFGLSGVCSLLISDCSIPYTYDMETYLPQSLRDANADSSLGFRICEVNPSDPVCAPQAYPNAVNHVFFRRLISTSSFVRNICPAVTQTIVWHLTWESRLESFYSWWGRSIVKQTDALNLLARYQSILQPMADSPDWKSDVVDPYDNGDGFVWRRYLDGGREFAIEALNCVNTIEAQIKQGVTTSQSANVSAAQDIDGILAFKELSDPATPAKKVWV